MKLRSIPTGLVRGANALVGRWNPMIADGLAMMDYFETGKYVADTRAQSELFGPVPTVEETARRILAESGLTRGA